MPRQQRIIFQPISRIEVTAIAFWEVVSQVNAINYDYERTSTPAGLSPNGNSFQMALLEPNRVSTVLSQVNAINHVLLIREHG
jgi:hypothetical protein